MDKLFLKICKILNQPNLSPEKWTNRIAETFPRKILYSETIKRRRCFVFHGKFARTSAENNARIHRTGIKRLGNARSRRTFCGEKSVDAVSRNFYEQMAKIVGAKPIESRCDEFFDGRICIF